ncbi:MAG TPA: hypothetical protein VGD01_01835 [Candidatus Elarobacter sp.]|jgi:hypothetical protein
MQRLAVSLAAAALAFTPAGALAQSSSPVPSSSPVTAPAPSQVTPTDRTPSPLPATPAASSAPSPMMTAPAPQQPAAHPTPAPATNDTKSNNGKHLGQVKKLQSGSLSFTDLRYALTHPAQEVGKVRAMKNVSFDKLRVYKLPTNLKTLLKVGDANADLSVLAALGPSIELAQTAPATNGSNSPIAILQYALANINVSNALNNVSVLNNSNVNVGVSLADVLNGNKISIGQVAGIFVNSFGIITTITK